MKRLEHRCRLLVRGTVLQGLRRANRWPTRIFPSGCLPASHTRLRSLLGRSSRGRSSSRPSSTHPSALKFYALCADNQPEGLLFCSPRSNGPSLSRAGVLQYHYLLQPGSFHALVAAPAPEYLSERVARCLLAGTGAGPKVRLAPVLTHNHPRS